MPSPDIWKHCMHSSFCYNLICDVVKWFPQVFCLPFIPKDQCTTVWCYQMYLWCIAIIVCSAVLIISVYCPNMWYHYTFCSFCWYQLFPSSNFWNITVRSVCNLCSPLFSTVYSQVWSYRWKHSDKWFRICLKPTDLHTALCPFTAAEHIPITNYAVIKLL